jgi:hypothetical protein
MTTCLPHLPPGNVQTTGKPGQSKPKPLSKFLTLLEFSSPDRFELVVLLQDRSKDMEHDA